MGEIASAAGLTRQTVYAHFSSRDAIMNALTERATARVTAALKAADLSRGRATEALLRLVQISWETFETETLLLNRPSPASDPENERQQHLPVLKMLHELVERGRQEGDFAPSLPANWIIAATVALGHAAGEEVRAGRMTSSQAGAVLQRALNQLFAE
jgi:AcrR family transcriptional regulator